MKTIELPLSLTISIPLKVEVDVDPKTGQSRGRLVGEMTAEESHKANQDTETARKNGGKILYATTSIEQQMEEVLLHYFIGPFVGHNPKRDLFEREVLQSTALNYHSKKELISKVMNDENLLDGSKKNRLQKLLKNIMIWRNAFAHGKIYYDTKTGCVIKFYSGEQKKLSLTNEYWDEVTTSFAECSSLLGELLKKLQTTSLPDADPT